MLPRFGEELMPVNRSIALQNQDILQVDLQIIDADVFLIHLPDCAGIRDIPAADSVSLMMPVLTQPEPGDGNPDRIFPDQTAVPCQVPEDGKSAVELLNLPFGKDMLLFIFHLF